MPFNEQERIDFVYPFTGNDPDMDLMLFFTDNVNEPKAINIRRCIHEDDEFTGNAPGYIGQELEDFIQACPRVPMVPIEFEYETDVNEQGVSLESAFKDTDGMIFAYQNVYRNGYVSAPSIYSKVAYAPTVASIGADPLVSAIVENRVSLFIPRQNAEVQRIRLLFKEGDSGNFKLIDEVSTTVDQANDDFLLLYAAENATDQQVQDGLVNDDYAGVYRFRNDRIYPVIPKDEADKHFDKLPQVAQAQGLSGHRIMYGNYVEGFDNIQAQATSSVVYKPRPADFVSFNLDVEPTFIDNASGNAASAAFIIDTAGMPEEIVPNNYQITINIRPRRNVHVYRVGSNNFVGSQQSSSASGLNFDANLPNIELLDGPILYGNPTGTVTVESSLGMFLANEGVASFAWKQLESENEMRAVGTTPAAPLILNVKNIPITFNFTTLDSGQTLTQSQLSSVVSIILSGDGLNTIQSLQSLGVELLDAPGFGSQGLTGFEFIRSSVSVDIDCGLSNGSEFSQANPLSELICTMSQGGLTNGFSAEKPGGFFIINRAEAKFGFEAFNDYNTTTKRGFRLRLDNLTLAQTLDEDGEPTGTTDENAILTCFPLPKMGQGEVSTIDGNEGVVIAATSPTRWQLDGNEKSILWPTVNSLITPLTGTNSLTCKTGYYASSSTQPFPTYYLSAEDASQQSASITIQYTEDVESLYNLPDAVSDSKMPAPIGDWVVYNKTGVEEEQFVDNYSVTVTNTAGTALAEDYGFGVGEDNEALNSLYYSITNHDSFGAGSINAMASLFTSTSFVNSATWAGHVVDFNFNLDFLDPQSENFDPTATSPYALVDGDVGPGGQRQITRPYSDTAISLNGQEENLSRPSWVPGDLVSIVVPPNQDTSFEQFANPSGPPYPQQNRYGSIWNTSLLGIVNNMPYIDHLGLYLDVTDGENIASDNHFKTDAFNSSPLEFINVVSNFASLAETNLSFKTRATHDFGIAYYDKRGRRSAINKLSSVYVPGYSLSERSEGTPRGPVAIKLRINSAAPSVRDANGDLLMDQYRIFYSNRNESKRFIQYSAGGAFTEKGDAVIKSKIYVSLNYLQTSNISYAEAYGARDADTDEPLLYRYSPGDKLRVISHYTSSGDIVYAEDTAVFTVLGVERLTAQLEDHPLYDNEEFSLLTQDIAQRNGEFLVLQNNEDAIGFSSADILDGLSLWNNRCIFEIVSPEKESADRIQAYFETNYGGRVIDGGYGVAIHEQPPIPDEYAQDLPGDNIDVGFIIEEGDVFFRSVPVNFRNYSSAIGAYADLINVNGEGGDISEPNFLPYYLETEAAIDLHRSKAKGYGKVNYIDPDVYRKRKQSSVTFSQKTNPSFFKLKHSSFPHYDNQMYFDLPEKHGEVNYIVGEDEYITSIQQNKAAVIPVDRSITETVQGETTLNISEEVLNSARFYIGEGGCSGNPESVVPVDGFVYFVDKANKRVCRLNPSNQSVEIISNMGMEEYFNRNLEELLDSSTDKILYSDIRIVGGFDPMENEYIVSFLKPNAINTPSTEGITAPNTHELLLPLARLELDSEGGHSYESFVNTAAFDHESGENWKTRYSFNSTNYAKVDNRFISFKPIDITDTGDVFVWDHGRNQARNFFHGVQYQSMLKAVSTLQNPSATKIYNAIGLEGTASWPAVIRTQNEICKVGDYRDYEGTKFSNIKGSRSNASTSNILAIGRVSNASFDVDAGLLTLTFETQVNRYPLNLGGSVQTFRMVNNSIVPVFTTVSEIQPASIVDDFTILYSVGSQQLVNPEEVQQLVGTIIIHRSNGNGYGDRPRDKYAIVSLYNASPEEVELFSINMDVSESNLDSSA
tara:strand:- start:11264 stop:16756 length:5493 start_codon:yes stop_codon:yes gene_type:complete